MSAYCRLKPDPRKNRHNELAVFHPTTEEMLPKVTNITYVQTYEPELKAKAIVTLLLDPRMKDPTVRVIEGVAYFYNGDEIPHCKVVKYEQPCHTLATLHLALDTVVLDISLGEPKTLNEKRERERLESVKAEIDIAKSMFEDMGKAFSDLVPADGGEDHVKLITQFNEYFNTIRDEYIDLIKKVNNYIK